jgi:RHS repeat-associated protein
MKRAICAAAIFLAGALDTAAQTTQWTTGTYSYDGSGNVRSITRSPADVDEYTYDAFGRVTKGTVRGGHAQEYMYDALGNLLTITTDGNTGAVRRPCVGANNQLLPSSSAGCNVTASYDAAGRMLSHSLPTGTYVYDSVDMITQSTIATDAGHRKALHLYTASDERVASIELDASNAPVRREYTVRDAASRVLRRFEQEGTAPVRWDEDYIYRGSQLIAAEVGTADRTRHFHVDHLGTPRLITGNGGVKISSHDYYPFGEEVTIPGDERLKFTGHERDAKTLDYMHARYYSPVWGRFLSVDPVLHIRQSLKAPQRWNRYTYVQNNPLRFTDPTGREGEDKTQEAEPQPHPVGPDGELLPPPVPLPPGKNGQPNEWVPVVNPNPRPGQRPVKWKPRHSVPSPTGAQPSGSWDPEGHYDVDIPTTTGRPGDRIRVLPDGTRLGPDHKPLPNMRLQRDIPYTAVAIGAYIAYVALVWDRMLDELKNCTCAVKK